MSKNLHDKFFVIFTAIAIFFKKKKNVCEKNYKVKKKIYILSHFILQVLTFCNILTSWKLLQMEILMAASCKINREVKHLGDILQSDQKKKSIFFVLICSVIIIIAAKTSVFIVVLRAWKKKFHLSSKGLLQF